MFTAHFANHQVNASSCVDALNAILPLAIKVKFGNWGQKVVSCVLVDEGFCHPSTPNIKNSESKAKTFDVYQGQEVVQSLSPRQVWKVSLEHVDPNPLSKKGIIKQSLDVVVVGSA